MNLRVIKSICDQRSTVPWTSMPVSVAKFSRAPGWIVSDSPEMYNSPFTTVCKAIDEYYYYWKCNSLSCLLVFYGTTIAQTRKSDKIILSLWLHAESPPCRRKRTIVCILFEIFFGPDIHVIVPAKVAIFLSQLWNSFKPTNFKNWSRIKSTSSSASPQSWSPLLFYSYS